MSKASREYKKTIKENNRWIWKAEMKIPRSAMTLSRYRASKRNEQVDRKEVRHLWLDEYSRLAHRNIDTEYVREYVRKTYTGDWKSAYRRQR